MSLSGKVGAVYKADGVSTTFTDAPTSKDGTYKRYWITDRTKAYWDDLFPITIKKNGVVQTSGFKIEYAGGYVEFDTPLVSTDVVLVSGKNFTVNQCATFFNWKLDIELETKDVTTFASGGWKEMISSIKGWSASAEGYWADETFFNMLGSRVILVLYVDYAGKDRYEGYIILKKCSIDEPVDDVVKESIDFGGTGALYFIDIA